ncbi:MULTISPECIES: hypothetical protein [Mesorhizobium]|uniref:Uncharacterized protein n=1 Tax=Mesorhizobium ciceri TaxID=39645 RepID=A0AB38T4K9_9HYPH|nr:MULTISPECIES: hypothetical protein [Mesorhizobium]MDF3217565.1 hypothetical protein [Mesorhizobium ciceri]UTU49765.1 hypothetical protein LRP29_19955 [Mesorhizobium ciceri]
MNSETIEIYHPRGVSNLGQWDIGGLKLKVYGLVADNKKIDEPMATLAQSFVRQEVLPRVADEGDENGMGFVIIHPGELGVSILAHWWIQVRCFVSTSIGSCIPQPNRWTRLRDLLLPVFGNWL